MRRIDPTQAAFVCAACLGFGITASAQSSRAEMDPPAVRTWGASVIAITFGDEFDQAAGEAPGSYEVQAEGKAAFQPGRVGRESKIQRYIPRGWPYKPVMRHTVFLALDRTLKPGAEYTVRVDSKVTGKAVSFTCRFEQAALVPELIKINQCGYLPDAPRKLAYLGGWIGSLGPWSAKDVSGKFRLVDVASGKTAFESAAVLSRKGDKESGEDVAWLDFSNLTKPGTYLIEVEGIGRSYPFRIADDVLDGALVTAARGLYHQRCGTALTEPYTSFTHPACHRDSAKLVDYYNSMDGKWMKMLPDHVDPSGKLVDGWGGWHDAGDYDRLLSRHIRTVSILLQAYDANPAAFRDGQFNIPESDNGIPDLLDEARWGMDWFERMFDPSDGAFYYRIETVNYGKGMPHQDRQQLYCMSKYPYYSCWAGVPFAHASRIFRPYDPARADRYLAIAKQALAFGKSKLSGDRRGRLPNAVARLAAEIYCASGDPATHKTFLAGKYRNSWSYALCEREDVDRRARDAARQTFIAAARDVLARLRADGYVTCLEGERGGSQAVTDAAVLLRGYAFNAETALRTAAQLNVDHHLGANPLGYSWITGVGRRYPKAILQLPSVYDGIDEPVPGIPVFGPRRLSPEQGQTHARVFAQHLFPEARDYPTLRLYSELPDVVAFSEFVTTIQSECVFVYSFFASQHETPRAP